MEAKELRIGNTTFEYNKDDKEWIVSNVSCWDFERARLNNNEIYLEHRKPIPLTEEILLKCGFEKHNKEFWFKDFFIGLIDNSFNLKEGIGVYVADVYYLHQLQNLYFALTNEELTVNL